MNRVAKYVAIISLSPAVFAFFAFVNRGIMTELFDKSVSAMFAISIFYAFIYKKPEEI